MAWSNIQLARHLRIFWPQSMRIWFGGRGSGRAETIKLAVFMLGVWSAGRTPNHLYSPYTFPAHRKGQRTRARQWVGKNVVTLQILSKQKWVVTVTHAETANTLRENHCMQTYNRNKFGLDTTPSKDKEGNSIPKSKRKIQALLKHSNRKSALQRRYM